MPVQPIPDGYHTITPYLPVQGATELLDFLKRAFNAVETEVMAPDGRVRHAEVRIGDSRVMMGETPKDPMACMLYLYVDDVDAWFDRAVKAGGEIVEKPSDQFYGDRHGAIKDPCGNVWYMATHIEDVSPEEMERRMKEASAAKG